MKHRFLAILMTLAMVMTLVGPGFQPSLAAEGTMEGDGTVDSPYLVEDAADFMAMEADGHYALADDITITASYPNAFSGSFEGCGYTITIKGADSEIGTGGVFTSLDKGAVVTDLTVDGTITNTGNLGGIANEAVSAKISRCVNNANITGTASRSRAAGIVGTSTGADNTLLISDCANNGTITVSGTSAIAAGIDAYTAGHVKVIRCYNTGLITAKSKAGGIVGQFGSEEPITYCFNTGEIEGSIRGAIVSFISPGCVLDHCFWVSDDETLMIRGGGNLTAESITESGAKEDMASLVEALGDAFTLDENGNPVLGWEAEGEEEPDPADVAMAEAILAKYADELGALRPAYDKYSDITEMVMAKIEGYGIEGLDMDMVSVSVNETEDPEIIDEDGMISYIHTEAPAAMAANSKNVGVIFDITYGTASVTTAKRMVTVGWDRDYVNEKIEEDADALTLESLLGDNTDPAAVESNLSLPQCFGTSAKQAWSVISWTSSDESVISFQTVEYSGITTPLIGLVTAPVEDTEVTLTATLKANDVILNSYVESQNDFTSVTKEFKVIVKGVGIPKPTEEELQAILAKYYTKDLLTDSITREVIDTAAVTGDIQLPRYTQIKDEEGNLVFVNKEITVTSSDDKVVSINGYRANVDRFQDGDKDVNLTVTLTREEVSASIQIPLKVIAVPDADLDAEIAKLEMVKEHYFDGINDGQYAGKDAVEGNLHAFQEANVDAEGNIHWVYTSTELTGQGIIADGYFDDSVAMELAGYNKFSSSDKDVIAHENLVVTRPENDTQVTITSWLSSAKYGKYAASHPDHAKLQKLFRQEVSVTVTVKGTKVEESSAEESSEEESSEENPSVDPTEPSVDPTEPSVDPTEPSVDPTEPSVDPTQPVTPAKVKIKSLKLGKNTFYYNKKVRRPGITVKDPAGKKLVKGKDFTVTIRNSKKKIVKKPKAVGRYKVTVKGKGAYKGIISKYYRILPGKAAIKSLKKKAGKLTVTMTAKPAVKGAGKYRIAYKLKTAKKWKTVNIAKKVKTFKLKKGKTYKIRVRAFKKVNGKTFYGKWSKVKTVKIPKK